MEAVTVENSVATLLQGEPGQMTWLEGSQSWLRPAYCFASSVYCEQKKCYHIWPLYLSYVDSETISGVRWRPVFCGRRLKKSSTFLKKKCTLDKILATPPSALSFCGPQCKILATPLTPGDLACGFSDLETTWLLYCAGAATVEKSL